MEGGNLFVNSFRKVDSGSTWKWEGFGGTKRRNENKRFSVAEFLQETGRKLEKTVQGPGVGFGIGCGVGLGMGVAGGFGAAGSQFNQLKMLFGLGIGCGVGLGFGYGQGIGYGSSSHSIWARFFEPEEKESRRRPLQLRL